jgi:hypothetical protein
MYCYLLQIFVILTVFLSFPRQNHVNHITKSRLSVKKFMGFRFSVFGFRQKWRSKSLGKDKTISLQAACKNFLSS